MGLSVGSVTLALVISTVLTGQVAYGHSGSVVNSTWATKPPTLDGTVAEGEWQAEIVNIPTKTPVTRLKASMDIGAMNDERSLYLLLKVKMPEDAGISDSQWFLESLYIDAGHDAIFNEGRDIVLREILVDTGGLEAGKKEPRMGVYSGDRYFDSRLFERGVGWTGDGWIYEMKIPFTLYDGYTWSKDSGLGLGVNWLTWGSQYFNDVTWDTTIYGVEQIIVPQNSTAHFPERDMQIENHPLHPTYPSKFMDIVLATDMPLDAISSGAGEQGTQTGEGANSTYMIAAVVGAGAAIAGAIVMTRKKGRHNERKE